MPKGALPPSRLRHRLLRPLDQGGKFVLVLDDLGQMTHPGGGGGPAHDIRMALLDPEAGVGVDKAAQLLHLGGRLGPAAQVQGEHPPPVAAAIGGVVEVVVEDDHIAGG